MSFDFSIAKKIANNQMYSIVWEKKITKKCYKRLKPCTLVLFNDNTILNLIVHLTMSRIWTYTLVVIGTDCVGSCKSYYHTIMTTTDVPDMLLIIKCIQLSERKKSQKNATKD
jgi:hypothetical protein